MIDFCTSSVLRPDVLYQCYKSFQEKLTGIDLKKNRLFLNIDPVPLFNWKHVPEENVKVASEFFGSVVVRIADQPCLGRAVQWLWSNAETELVFLLEDDWELLDYVNIEEMIQCFSKKPSLQQVRLTWRHKSYMTKNIVNYGLSAGITRKKYCKHYGTLMNGIKKGKLFNAEKFIRRPARHIRYCSKELTKEQLQKYKTPSLKKRKREVMYYPPYKQRPKPIIKNLSDEWKVKHNFIGSRVSAGGRWKMQ